MFIFVIEVIGISILVSLFATAIKLIPRYSKKKYYFIQELTNAAMMGVVLTIIETFEISLSWIFLFLLILFVLWLSVQVTNNIVQKSGESMVQP